MSTDISKVTKGWAWWTFWASIVLLAAGLAGFLATLLLSEAALRETLRACAVDESTAHFSKGYSFALAIGVLVALLLGIAGAVIVIAYEHGTSGRMKIAGGCLVVLATLPTLGMWFAVTEYHDYPGSDASTAMGHPCGCC